MESNTRMLELFAVGVVMVSLGLNMAVICIVAHQLRFNATLGLKMVFVVAAFDLFGPLTGAVQEAFSVSLQHNVMENHTTCQLLGAIHSVIPFMSTTSVAIMALERCLYIHDRPLRPRSYLLIALGTLALASVLAFLTAYNNQFELAPCRIACNMSPRKGIYGALYFYTFLGMLVVNGVVIFTCYTSIIRLGLKPIPQPTRHVPRHSLDSDGQISMNSRTLGSLLKKQDPPSLKESPRESPRECLRETRSFMRSNAFAFRAGIIMMSYMTVIAPCVILMSYEAYTGLTPTYLRSSLVVMLLFSFTLVNPILLILLHTSISRAFAWPFQKLD